jgi:hypothetical protein
MRKSLIAMVITLLVCSSGLAGTYSGGTGTTTDPYQIATAADWLELVNTTTDRTKAFVMTADIDLAGVALSPVGAFTGSFNGNGHTISNAVISAVYYTSQNTGLFGYIGTVGTLTNVTLKSADVRGYKNVGSLVGNNSGTISNCRVGGHVTTCVVPPTADSSSSPWNIGGMVGYSAGTLTDCQSSVAVDSIYLTSNAGGMVGQAGGTITRCSASGPVSFVQSLHGIGGLIGTMDSGTVTNCYATGDVSGDTSAGGLIGWIWPNYSPVISGCFATGSVTANINAGGLIALLMSGATASLSNCYATGSVTSISSTGYAGGLIGYADSSYYSISLSYCYSAGKVTGANAGGLVGSGSASITRCYWDTETSGCPDSTGNRGRMTIQMQLQSTFVDWDFTNIWRICGEGLQYPRLRWELQTGDWACPEGVSIEDMAYLAQRWLSSCSSTNFWCSGADIDQSKRVGFSDFALMAAGWTPLVVYPGPYSGGTGEPNDPYQIANRDDWRELMSKPVDWSKCFILTADLELYGMTLTTIGNGTTKFTGSFDGDGHVISNATMNPYSSTYVALFGYLGPGGRIRNLGMASVAVTGGQYTAAMVAYNSYGRLDNCYSSGTVTGGPAPINGPAYAGGLVGYNNYGDVNDSHASGTVASQSVNLFIGGLVGSNISGAISSSYSNCTVTARAPICIGGLVGRNGGTVANCYASGAVDGSGAQYTGGLSGMNPGTLANCYATGTVVGPTSGSLGIGGLSGSCSGTIISSFWDIGTSGLTGSYGGRGLTTAQMKTMSIYQNAGWGGNGWVMSDGLDYPKLASQGTAGTPIPDAMPVPLDGAGTSEEPYVIRTPADLATLSWYSAVLEKYIVLFADLDMSGTAFYPIGDLGPFSGTFNGNRHIIRNLTINNSTSSYVGMFSFTDRGSEVWNLGLESAAVSGYDYVGGMFGRNRGGLSGCYVSGTVSGHNYTGGLAGLHYGNLNNSYATGTVAGGTYAAGLVGSLSSASVTNCYAAAAVSGSANLGGLIAGNTSSTVTGSFWDTAVSSRTTSAGGTGKSTAEMKTAATFLSAGWDFTGESANGTLDWWKMGADGADYPRLFWQP